jgi:hypothetical protein
MGFEKSVFGCCENITMSAGAIRLRRKDCLPPAQGRSRGDAPSSRLAHKAVRSPASKALWRSRTPSLRMREIGEPIEPGAGVQEINGHEAHGSHSRDPTELSVWSYGQRGRQPAGCNGQQYQLSIKQARCLWDHRKDARPNRAQCFPMRHL